MKDKENCQQKRNELRFSAHQNDLQQKYDVNLIILIESLVLTIITFHINYQVNHLLFKILKFDMNTFFRFCLNLINNI